MNDKEQKKLEKWDNIVSLIVGFGLVGFFVVLWIVSEFTNGANI